MRVFSKFLALIMLALLLGGGNASAQLRYVNEMFNDAQLTVTSNVVYGQNHHFFPPTTTYPVLDLKMRVYQPDQTVDTRTDRPVIVYIHTGNFLPPVINGGIGGSIDDSAAVNLCKQWAKRGYVVIAPAYRVGWNPLAATELERRAQLLNAVYRAINDIKCAVRFMRKSVVESGNPYKINPDDIVLYGQGSGGYVALAYVTMDKHSEIAMPKFQLPNGQSVVDTNVVGNLQGFNGLLNRNNHVGYSSSVKMSINAGGALADTTWLEAGDAPMISFHSVRDPFAPYRNGIVVVPTTMGNVVEVQGPGIFIDRANRLGNNAVFSNASMFTDPVSNQARSWYNQTIPYIYPAPNDQINVGGGEGLFPIVRPIRNHPAMGIFSNETDPWTWWDSATLVQYVAAVNAQTGGTYSAASLHAQGMIGNPNMSQMQGLTFIDTIQQYIQPRIMKVLQRERNVTFRVNMTNQSVDPAGMHVAGNFQGWTPANSPMSVDPNNPNVWVYTAKIPQGSRIEYKFVNGLGGWEGIGGLSCANAGGNRHLAVENDTTLGLVVYGRCDNTPPGLPRSVTFQVDMTGLTVSPLGVHVAGGFQGWNPGGTPMSPSATNPSIYTYTTQIQQGVSFQFKYVNGNAWGSDESVPGACGLDNGFGGYNRYLTVVGDTVLPAYLFGSCNTAGTPIVNRTVRIQVNMAGQTIHPAGVGVAGNFQGWNPAATRMIQSASNANIYYFDTTLAAGYSMNYKFINGDSWGQDEPSSGPCFNGGNRGHELLVDTVLPAYLFGGCTTGFAGAVNGTLTYDNTASTPMTNTTVNLVSAGATIASVTTSSTGGFSFSNVPNGTYSLSFSTSKPWGGVSSTDALQVSRHTAQVALLSGIRLTAADVNASNSVTSTDALQISRRVAQQIASFTAGNWRYGNPSITVNDNTVTSNVKALCTGDVNGSGTPNVNLRESFSSMDEQGVVHTSATGYDFNLYSEQNMSLGAATINLALPVGMEVTSVVSTGPSAQDVVFHQKGNELRIAWHTLSQWNVSAGAPIFRVSAKGLVAGALEVGSFTELANSWAETLPGFSLRGPRLVSTPAAQFSVYPNPSSGLFEVQTVQLADEILISDVIGREVRRVVPISTATSMNLSNQPHGVYFVQVRTGNNVETKRLVIR
jgi:Secretion system C-terminal sorting domain/Dockerin type I domain/Carboxylesterase family